MKEDIPDVIWCFKFGDNRFRGLASAEGQILPFPIGFEGRPYNTLTLPCERVIRVVFSGSVIGEGVAQGVGNIRYCCDFVIIYRKVVNAW